MMKKTITGIITALLLTSLLVGVVSALDTTQNETIEAQAHEIEQLKERVKQLEEELMRYQSQG